MWAAVQYVQKLLYVFFFIYLHPRYCSHGQLGSGAKLKITTCFKNERYGRVCGCSMCVSLCVFARFVIMYITLVQVTVHQRIFDRVEYRKACHILLAIAYGNTIFNKPSNIIYFFFFFHFTYIHAQIYVSLVTIQITDSNLNRCCYLIAVGSQISTYIHT